VHLPSLRCRGSVASRISHIARLSTVFARGWGNETEQAGDLEASARSTFDAVSDRRSDLDGLAAVHCHSTVVLQEVRSRLWVRAWMMWVRCLCRVGPRLALLDARRRSAAGCGCALG
jgi:hypothetical protein